eukprot:Hpha_TRINITY_DN27477_c0_g1::TRINITY_DN27477_c0_g1_i1::g.193854::m.193854
MAGVAAVSAPPGEDRRGAPDRKQKRGMQRGVPRKARREGRHVEHAEQAVGAMLQRAGELQAAAAAGQPPELKQVERFAQSAAAAALQCCQHEATTEHARKVLDCLAELLEPGSVVSAGLPAQGRGGLEASVCSNYAVLYKHTGQWDAALRQCTRALHKYRTLREPPPADVAAASLNMAAILGTMGRHRSAAQHARAAVELIDSAAGEAVMGGMLAVALYNLAVELQHCRDWRSSRDALLRASKISRRYLPAADVTAQAINALLRTNTRRKINSVASVAAPRSAAGSETPEEEGMVAGPGVTEKDSVVDEAPRQQHSIPSPNIHNRTLRGWEDEEGVPKPMTSNTSTSASPKDYGIQRQHFNRVPSYLPPLSTAPPSPGSRGVSPSPQGLSPLATTSFGSRQVPRPPGGSGFVSRAPRALRRRPNSPSDEVASNSPSVTRVDSVVDSVLPVSAKTVDPAREQPPPSPPPPP